MTEKKYSKKHEWLEVNGSVATVGITAHAASQLGDIVFAEVPAAGKSFKKDDPAAVLGPFGANKMFQLPEKSALQ